MRDLETARENVLARRAQVFGEMRSVLSAARKASRDLTAAEAARYDRLEEEFRSLSDRADSFELGGGPARGEIRNRPDRGSGLYANVGREGLFEWLGGEMRSLVEGSGPGSFIVPPQFSTEAWDLIAARSVGIESGFTVVETSSDEFHLPVVQADAAAGWYAEAATISETDPDVDEVVARPRKLAALVRTSNELLDDSNPSALQLLFQGLARNLALTLDQGFYLGTGVAPQITGLRLAAGTVYDMGTNGAELTNLDPFANAIGLLEEDNATATAIVMHPRDWKTLLKLKEQTGSLKPVMQDSAGSPTAGVARSIYGVPVLLSSQLATDEDQGTATDQCSSIYVYEAAQVVVVRRSAVQIEVDRSVHFASDQALVRAKLRADLVVPHPQAVARIRGIKPTT